MSKNIFLIYLSIKTDLDATSIALFLQFPNSFHYLQLKNTSISLMAFPSSCKSGSSQIQLYVCTTK